MKKDANGPWLVLSNKIVVILATQGASKLLQVKSKSPRKTMNMLTLVNIGNPEREGTSRCFTSTFGLPQFCSPSSCNDGTNQGPNAVWLVESITSLLKYVCNLCSKYPHFNSTFLFSRGTKFINFQELYVWCNQFFQLNSTTNRGPRYYLDILAIDIFGKFVPIRNFKKGTIIIWISLKDI